MKIEARGVEFSYKNNHVLRGLDFSAVSGDVVAVLGPNGAGKSTLFRCLLGFLRPQKGAVRIDGRDIRTMSHAETARHMAYIPQSVSPVFNYTVMDTALMGMSSNIGMFSSPRKQDIEKAAMVLESLGIAELRHRGCLNISGGERQLALLARALLQDARILIMDEPAANLDCGNTWRVMERIAALASDGYVALFSTHDPNQAFFHANRALVMREGKIISDGSPRNALSGEVLSELYNMETLVHELSVPEGETVVSFPARALRGKTEN